MTPFLLLSLMIFGFLFTLMFADAYLTWRILSNGGRELNPLVRFLIERFGLVPALVTSKVIVLVIVALFSVPMVPQGALSGPLPPLMALVKAIAPLVILTLVYVWVVRHNWLVLRKSGQA